MNLGPQLMAPLIQYQALDQPQIIRIKDKELLCHGSTAKSIHSSDFHIISI